MGDFKTFDDLVFTKWYDKPNVYQAVLCFDNGYGVSVIKSTTSPLYGVSSFMEDAEGVRKSLGGVKMRRSPYAITTIMQRLQNI